MRRAFNAVEVIVVIAIIGLLIAILLPVFSRIPETKTKPVVPESQLIRLKVDYGHVEIHEVTLNDHSYFLASKESWDGGLSLVHAESCPCLQE